MQLFGLGVNNRVYAANFSDAAVFQSGWMTTAPGLFGHIAAAPLGSGPILGGIDLGEHLQANPRV